jgi:redox-sensitive bicupin YhaK (pirin superfamily)
MTTALSVREASKIFGGQVALDHVSIDVAPGEVRALVGQNGCGKSTLIKILAGFHQPEQGTEVTVGGDTFAPGRMLVFRAGDGLALTAGPQGARLLLLGGAAMDGPRYVFWNFVSSSRERIEQAKADWQAQAFPKVPSDDQEFIPLPENQRIRAATPPG